MDPSTWTAIGGVGAAFLTALGAWLWSIMSGRRMDTLHAQLRDTALVAQSSQGEVKHLQEELRRASAAIAEARRAARDEAGALRAALEEARERIAASSTPAGIREGLTRRDPEATIPVAPRAGPAPSGPKTPPPGAKTPLPGGKP